MIGTFNLTETSPTQSFDEPVSLADVKAFLLISDFRGGAEIAMVESMITAARVEAELRQHRDLVEKQWDLVFDYWPGEEIPLRAPLASVDLVRYTDEDDVDTALVAGTDYITDTSKMPGIVRPAANETWPSFTPKPTSAILIRFTSGYENTAMWWAGPGQAVKQGMLLLISQWYSNRLPFETGRVNITEFPYAVTHLLSSGAVPVVR